MYLLYQDTAPACPERTVLELNWYTDNMVNTILLDGKEYQIGRDKLPCLIHYGEGSGGSHFSITLVANLFLRGEKILFLTAYPMAKDSFLQQIGGHESKVDYVSDTRQLATDAQAIVLESGNEGLYLQAIERLGDLDERIVLIKNMEVFGDAVIDSCLQSQNVILSGDIDKCASAKRIANKQYETIVLFSQPDTALTVKPPKLEKYTGYLQSTDRQGLVTVQMDK